MESELGRPPRGLALMAALLKGALERSAVKGRRGAPSVSEGGHRWRRRAPAPHPHLPPRADHGGKASASAVPLRHRRYAGEPTMAGAGASSRGPIPRRLGVESRPPRESARCMELRGAAGHRNFGIQALRETERHKNPSMQGRGRGGFALEWGRAGAAAPRATGLGRDEWQVEGMEAWRIGRRGWLGRWMMRETAGRHGHPLDAGDCGAPPAAGHRPPVSGELHRQIFVDGCVG